MKFVAVRIVGKDDGEVSKASLDFALFALFEVRKSSLYYRLRKNEP